MSSGFHGGESSYCDTVTSGRWVVTIQENMLPPSSRYHVSNMMTIPIESLRHKN